MILLVVAQAPGVDPDTIINSLTPLILAMTALVAGGAVLYRFVSSDLAAAIAQRIRAGIHRRQAIDVSGDAAADERRVAGLEQQVETLQGHVAELAERLDFAERLLAQARAERKLPAGE